MNNISDKIITLVEQAKQAVARNVNSAMVFTYYHIGRLLVEEWQQGEERAEYGTQLIATVSADLTKAFGKGFSVPNLERMRNFFLIYSNCSKELRNSVVFQKSANVLRISDESQIFQSVTGKSEESQISSTVSRKSDESPISSSVMRKSDEFQISSTLSRKSGEPQIYATLSRKSDESQISANSLRKSDESQISQTASGIFENEADIRFLPISWTHYSFLIRIRDEITLPENNRQIFASQYETILPSKKQFIELLKGGI